MSAAETSRTVAASAAAPHYPWLDALRAFAALSVLGFHLISLAGLVLPQTFPFGWLHAGFWGVDLFFAISGAVMVLSTAGLRSRFGPRWRAEFVRRRLVRIVPLYLLTSLVFIALVQPTLLSAPGAGWNLLSHALFIHNWFAATHGALNGPSWSLGVEMQFYALVCLGAGWMLGAKLRWLLLAGLAVELLWRGALWWRLGSTPPPIELVFIQATQLPGVLLGFVSGMLAARWLDCRPQPLSPGQRWAVALGLLLGWTLAVGWLFDLQAGYWLRLEGLLGCHWLVAGLSGGSVWLALQWPAPSGLLRSVLKRLGDASYGIYLWHMPVLLWLASAWPAASAPARSLAVLLLTLLLALLSWQMFEAPLQRRLRRATPADQSASKHQSRVSPAASGTNERSP